MSGKSDGAKKSKFSKGMVVRCRLKTRTADYALCTAEHCGGYLLVEYTVSGTDETGQSKLITLIDRVRIEEVTHCSKVS